MKQLKSKAENTEQTEVAGSPRALQSSEITEIIIGAAIEVHRATGPGLMESVYEECLCYELSQRGLSFQRQVELPVVYKGINLKCGLRMDLVVANEIVLELCRLRMNLGVTSRGIWTTLISPALPRRSIRTTLLAFSFRVSPAVPCGAVVTFTNPWKTRTPLVPSRFTSTPNSVPRSVTVAVGVRMQQQLGIRDWGFSLASFLLQLPVNFPTVKNPPLGST